MWPSLPPKSFADTGSRVRYVERVSRGLIHDGEAKRATSSATMTRLHGVILLCGIWAALYAASVLVPYTTAPTDFGLTRGMNRVELFFKYQIAAGVVAIVAWWVGRKLTLRWQRWLSRMPVILAIGLFLLTVGVIVAANMNRPGPTDYVPDPDRPVAAPAQPVAPVAPEADE